MTSAPDDRRARGREKMQEVYNFSIDPDEVPGDFAAFTVDHLFGEIWSRPGLSGPHRRLLAIGVLATLGQQALLEVQLTSALDNGELSELEVREIVVHLAHYVGWPLASVVNEVAERVIARRLRARRPPGEVAEGDAPP